MPGTASTAARRSEPPAACLKPLVCALVVMMTGVGWGAILLVALPYWALVGEPLVRR